VEKTRAELTPGISQVNFQVNFNLHVEQLALTRMSVSQKPGKIGFTKSLQKMQIIVTINFNCKLTVSKICSQSTALVITNLVKALKKTQSTKPIQYWSGLLFSSFTTKL